jgi:hypothetical protein
MRALNIERITAPPSRRRNSSGRWRTTSAHSEFEAQVYRTSENRTVAGAQGKPWRQLLGVTSALTVVFTPGEGQLSIDLGVTSGLMRR